VRPKDSRCLVCVVHTPAVVSDTPEHRPDVAPGRRRTSLLIAAGVLVIAWSCGGTTSTNLIGPSEVRCAVSLLVPDGEMPAARTSGSIDVAAERECAWSARSEVDWIALTSASGQGDGRIEFVVAENAVPVARSGRIVVAEEAAALVQAAAPCRFTLQPDSAEVGPAGGAIDVEIATHPGCAWEAGSEHPWIVIGPAAGEGPATITLQVLANTGPPRAGHLVIAGQPFGVSQGASCTVAIGSTASHLPAAGGLRTVAVEAAPWCEWSAASDVPWTTVSPGHGAGSATLTLTVAANDGPVRTGRVTMSGQVHTITQDAAPCTYDVAPLGLRVPFSAGTYAIAVQTPPWCGWQASSHATWIRIAGGSEGLGAGTVTIEVSGRSLPLPRTGTLTVAGQTVTVTQTLVVSDSAP
jgi:hypothetical protein